MEFLSGSRGYGQPFRRTMKSTCSCFYVRVHAPTYESAVGTCTLFSHETQEPWSSTDAAICASNQVALRVLSAGLANSMHRKALRGSRTLARGCLTYMALLMCLLYSPANFNRKITISKAPHRVFNLRRCVSVHRALRRGYREKYMPASGVTITDTTVRFCAFRLH